ncbi:helix-turn-helix domain-containing protein [Paenibacillus donghaensis]|uniref:HTH cro/C1-type domain-containing protein n=1 Tax=Paenibacillus donghaensis TaxID=414771 RepID=A0A2Z2KMM0_9BACL|nr:helix-turn-helix transcriptional regulator [Paenibacillus donghaensis]ASA21281.1 hypothetical protein B9T62_11085 [Paenibacillus donghaensis]
MNITEFGEYIRDLRKKKGYNLTELAEKTGVSHPYLSQIENGKLKKMPSAEILGKIAGHLGESPFNLMMYAGHIPTYVSREQKYDRNSMGKLTLFVGDDIYFDEEAFELRKELDATKTKYRAIYNHSNDGDFENPKDRELWLLLNTKGIMYRGQTLSDKDRQRILDMLAILFPDRQ